MLPDLQLEMMPVASLAPYAANARLHPTEQVAQLAASIGEFGFNVPVLVDDAGVLIAGHGCVLAVKALGLDAVPAIRLGHLTEAQARAFRLADNQLALNSTWDESLLAAELRALRTDEFDLGLIDFDQAALDRLLGEAADVLAPGSGDSDAPAPAPPEEALRPFARRIAAGIASANQPPGLPTDWAPRFMLADAALLVLAWHARRADGATPLPAALGDAATAFLAAVAAAIAPPDAAV